MLSQKALRNQKRLQYLLSKDIKNKPIKKLDCNEDSQVFNWQRTNKKAVYKDYAAEGKLKQYRNDKRNNKNRS
jgi:hypothetical protein